jgi:hypothetical protein
MIVLSLLYILHERAAGALILTFLIFNCLIFSAFAVYKEPAMVLDTGRYITKNILNTQGLREVLSLISDDSYRTRAGELSKRAMRENIPLQQQTMDRLGEGTVDVFPWDISVAYAYGLNWSPRAIFQSYQANTSALDRINASHFQAADSPDRIMYAFKSIDYRYPVFDEPSTFQELLCGYRASGRDGPFVILERQEESSCRAKTAVISLNAGFGEKLKVPVYKDGHVLASINLQYSLKGKIMGCLYKPAPVYVTLLMADGTSSTHRFIPDAARNGIFLSQYVHDVEDLYSVFSGNINSGKHHRIAAIFFDAENQSHYAKTLEVKFAFLPADASYAETPTQEQEPNWQRLVKRTGGMMHVDLVDGIRYDWIMKKTIIDLNKKTFSIEGWAVDDARKSPGDGVYVVFRNETEEKTFPAVRTDRFDVARAFGEKDYILSGWQLMSPIDNFQEGCYDTSLRVLQTGRKGYYEMDIDRQICFERLSAMRELGLAGEYAMSLLDKAAAHYRTEAVSTALE